MSAPLFLSLDARQRDAWRAAFPGLRTARVAATPLPDADTVWLLLTAGDNAGVLAGQIRRRMGRGPLVVLSDAPSEDEALAALAAGAAGYCNGHAAPEVLRQVAAVVEQGGVWVGQGLMQRLLAATSRVVPSQRPDGAKWRIGLTARETETAHLVAQGASNKEIARQLGITERTVKAHVGALLDKLCARDRMQLALIVNGIEDRPMRR